jgi:hypothetical protein
MSRIFLFASLILQVACAGRVLQFEQRDRVLKVDEYDKQLEVKPLDAAAGVTTASGSASASGAASANASASANEVGAANGSASANASGANGKGNKGSAKANKAGKKGAGPIDTGLTDSKTPTAKAKNKDGKVNTSEVSKPQGRQPEIEDSVGMAGRRPIKDPFKVGERIQLNLSYFNVVAGTMDIEVKPFVNVNNKKAYNFEVRAKSNSFFSRVYAVDDTAVTYMSYDEFVPFNLVISLKESKQLAETRTIFDYEKLKGNYWQKKFTERDGETSKHVEWDILSYSQNVISAAFYMRIFEYEVGKWINFRIADEGKNIVFKAQVVRREILKTDAGDFDTWVLKPELTVDGVFTPVGEIMVWLTADDRKFIVRMESKIKIGKLVAKLKSIEKGRD